MGGVPPLSNDDLQKVVDAYIDSGRNAQRAADTLKIPRTTLNARLKSAALRGLCGFDPVIPGFEIKKVSNQVGPDGEVEKTFIQSGPESGEAFAVPEGHSVKGISARVDADGKYLGGWIKTKEGDFDPRAIAEWLKTSFETYKPAAKISKPPKDPSSDYLTLIPCNDWHVGMYSWKEETGENWDLKIAEDKIGAAIENVIERSTSSDQAIILGGGDLMHADNKHNQTDRSKNVLDVDGRYPKVVDVATRIMVRTIDAALRKHQHVTVRILPGNHDEHASVAIAYFLKAWYRNEPRATIDTDPSLFFWFRFGSVLLGATHGHEARVQDMPGIMSHRRAEDWGQTKFRYVHGFHLHHKKMFAEEGGGCISEVHQAPIPQDSWHYGKGFLSGRSVQAITYHRLYGESDRVRKVIMDAEAGE